MLIWTVQAAQKRHKRDGIIPKVSNMSEDELRLHDEVSVVDNGHFDTERLIIDSEEVLDMEELPGFPSILV